MSDGFSHLDAQGRARMVDVGAKPATERVARAEGVLRLEAATLAAIESQALAKGDVLAVARVAGILAAKRTAELIPLCHTVPLSSVEITFEAQHAPSALRVEAVARTTAATGVEMEALTAVSIALLTLYDMAKSREKGMRIEGVRLLEKRGGASGDYRA